LYQLEDLLKFYRVGPLDVVHAIYLLSGELRPRPFTPSSSFVRYRPFHASPPCSDFFRPTFPGKF
jgi:hypothetical protein